MSPKYQILFFRLLILGDHILRMWVKKGESHGLLFKVKISAGLKDAY